MADSAHGRFHWNELLTNDIEAAKAFYGSMMGWVYDEMDMTEGQYLVAIKGNDPVAGITKIPDTLPADTQSHWMSFIEVQDIDGQVAKAKDAGANIMKGPYNVPEVGRIAVLQDPTGAVIGWITPDFDD